LDLVSIAFLTNAWVDSPIFWWVIAGDRRKVPFEDQLRHSSKMAAILDLVSIDFLTNAWVEWSNFFVAHLGVTGGRFPSMTSAAAHPTWPLWQPSWILFLSII
jgi:hypothetical protein